MATAITSGLFSGLQYTPGTADLSNLNPTFATRLANMLHAASAQGIATTITQGYRSTADQARIYNSGVRPAAQPGHSYHEFGNAADVYAVNPSQQGALNSMASQFGLFSGAAFGDSGHFQIGTSNINAATAASQFGSTNGAPYSPGSIYTAPDAAPAAPAVTTDPNSSMFDGNSGLAHGSDAFGDESGAGSTSGSFVAPISTGQDVGLNTGAVGGTANPADLGGPTQAVAGGDTGIPGVSTQGTGTFLDTSATPAAPSDAPVANATPVSPATGNPIQPKASAGSGASASTAPTGKAPTVNTQSTGGGAPLDLTNAPDVGTKAAGTIAQGATTAANTVSKALGGVTSGAAADTASAEGTGTGWLNSIFGAIQDVGVRAAFILAGLFILLGAFLFFYIDAQKSGPSITVAAE